MKKGCIKNALKTAGGVLAVVAPMTASAFSLALTFSSIDGIVKANHRVKAINRSIEDSELLHKYGNDENALEVLDNTLHGESEIKSNSYADALISSREQINLIKEARSTLVASSIATGLFSVGTAGLAAAIMAEINDFGVEIEKEEEKRKEKEEKERLEKDIFSQEM